MSTTQQQRGGRQYAPASMQRQAEAMYRQPSYDRSFDSIRYPSNASQPSLSHSFNTYTDSTPSSVCRPEFGDYPHDMSQSDCGASFVSEVPASFDDTSDIDDAPVSNNSKPTLIKFVEPVVQRDRSTSQTRLTGMKKKRAQRKMAASSSQHERDLDVDHLPILGFADSRMGYAPDEAMHKETYHFPGVPPRDAQVTPKQEQWNVDAIDIALEDLVLDKGKTRSSSTIGESPFADIADNTASSLRKREAMSAARGGAASSVLDEAQEEDRPRFAPTRSHTSSDARRAPRPPPSDVSLPPVPALPSPSTVTQDSAASSTMGKVEGLQPSHDHPLATPSRADEVPIGFSTTRISALDTPESDENVFAFRPPSLPGHGDDPNNTMRGSRIARSTGVRLDSMASSNHSSLRDLDPREMLQRARMQPLSCGLDAEVGLSSLDVEAEFLGSDSGSGASGNSVQAEDLPPLLSNHYLQGKVDPAEFERLNRLPERKQAAAAAAGAASGSSHRLSHKHLSKHKKSAGTASVVHHYEPISILRAEAAFLKEDAKKADKDKKKKDKLWATGSSTNASTSDVSSVSDGHQRLKSFKSTMRLNKLK
ncbi:hypothetical protein EX895_005343 [Sporisorium graminicola]|uniref:Uncharacterized protein n=1 Tax=Sporisorium graminicola TaxID=280036 RepID=A0A4U7KS43_9BASI|nr:hypothetical protein EX895_005343 [Sporisorium graminicola]TKY85802.1 hypothetical protein EX895_005343 [Sporisorium graminicola]